MDTNIIIDHLRESGLGLTSLMDLNKKYTRHGLALTVISIQELYEGKSTKDSQKLDQLTRLLAPIRVLPYTYEIALRAGEIARDIGSPIEFADAAIAATCIVNGGDLATLNVKHFGKISGLNLIKN
ncbi:MAG: PIN domain-containing protein [Candidatus Dojkabacteria bacterium]